MRLLLEGTLLEKLRKIEALHAGTKVDGEREAARRAAERIRARLSAYSAASDQAFRAHPITRNQVKSESMGNTLPGRWVSR
jgi:hypothetical protein